MRTNTLPDGYEHSFDPARVDVDLVWRTLASLYWSPNVRRDIVETALTNSIVLGVYAADGGQVAYARVVSDRATFAWVCDVFVLEAHRGKGIAHAIITRLHAHPELQTVRRWMLGTADAHEIYNAFGYATLVETGRLMDRRNPPERWQDTDPIA